MLLTRWKLMAGVLGVSIGGLAAAASQCPKLDKTKGRSPDAPVVAEAPKLPPAGAPSAAPKLPELPAPAPAAPQLTPGGVTPVAGIPLPGPSAFPDAKAPPPAPVGSLPALPDFPTPTPEPKPAKAEDKAPPPGFTLPEVPPAVKPAVPMTPPKPVAEAPKPVPVELTPPTPSKPTASPDGRGLVGTPQFTGPGGEVLPLNPVPSKPTATPPVMPIGGTQPVPDFPAPSKAPEKAPPALPVPTETPAIEPTPSKPTPAPAEAGTVKVGAVKYRILLRVGEGEPTFEVKSGDDLVLKVACEKVDIKSPEKGAGLSAVTAKGKVRFAGFGVEGSCDELSFMAGTGEVSMTGEVKVQMKDKLGRVESELTTSTLKYKIDASAVGAAIKP